MDYVLGLDLGSASLGWAVLELRHSIEDGWQPFRIERTGVRKFAAGVDGMTLDAPEVMHGLLLSHRGEEAE